ncbi:hypothetical protein C5167_038382 [Papaver somniferum]|uniref:Uncharacterized protein n=1 Tax=Papaver somniferum TaxID=3469 RepID=A0A4Y7IDC2_PAPSO|nr:hypothetical protein C5167_038382 [Papaver somniferum]
MDGSFIEDAENAYRFIYRDSLHNFLELFFHLDITLTIMAKTFLLHHAFPEDGCMLQRDAMESRVVGFLQEVCFILCCRIVWEVGTSFRKRLINRYRINSADKNTENLPKVLWCHNHQMVDGKWQRFQQFQQAGVEEPSPKLNSKEAANKTTLCAVFPPTDRPLR